jgi:hypothetical protein
MVTPGAQALPLLIVRVEPLRHQAPPVLAMVTLREPTEQKEPAFEATRAWGMPASVVSQYEA